MLLFVTNNIVFIKSDYYYIKNLFLINLLCIIQKHNKIYIYLNYLSKTLLKAYTIHSYV